MDPTVQIHILHVVFVYLLTGYGESEVNDTQTQTDFHNFINSRGNRNIVLLQVHLSTSKLDRNGNP